MNARAMEIRVLTPDDSVAYWNIRLEALEGDLEAFSASAEEHRSLTLEDVAARLCPADQLNNFVIGAFSEQRLTGTAGFYRDKGLKERHKGHIWGVYVRSEARGKGVGHEMLRALLNRAAALEGLEQIMVSATATQNAALKLYRKLGFQPYGCEPRAIKVGERYIDEQLLVFFIPPSHERIGP